MKLVIDTVLMGEEILATYPQYERVELTDEEYDKFAKVCDDVTVGYDETYNEIDDYMRRIVYVFLTDNGFKEDSNGILYNNK